MITSCLLLRVCVVVLRTLVQCGSKSLFLPTWQLPVQSERLFAQLARLALTLGSGWPDRLYSRTQPLDSEAARGKIASRNFLSFSPQR